MQSSVIRIRIRPGKPNQLGFHFIEHVDGAESAGPWRICVLLFFPTLRTMTDHSTSHHYTMYRACILNQGL